MRTLDGYDSIRHQVMKFDSDIDAVRNKLAKKMLSFFRRINKISASYM